MKKGHELISLQSQFITVGIDVSGLDEVQKYLNELVRSADPNTFNEWANRIGKTAKEICNDPDCKRIKLIKDGDGKIKFQFADKEAIECVIQAINRHQNSMPMIQQEIFKQLVTEFQRIERESIL